MTAEPFPPPPSQGIGQTLISTKIDKAGRIYNLFRDDLSSTGHYHLEIYDERTPYIVILFFSKFDANSLLETFNEIMVEALNDIAKTAS